MKIPADFDRSRIYYLAGPMSGLPEHNYPAFEACYKHLTSRSVGVISPHVNYWPEILPGYEPLTERELWLYMMKSALKMLLMCNGIILLPNWKTSEGVKLERTVAQKLEYPEYQIRDDELVRTW